MVKTERSRYIVFEVKAQSALSRRDMIAAFQRCSPVKPWLVIFDGSRGIVRSAHTQKDAVIAVLNSVKSVAGMPAGITTIATSGTIKCAKERLAKKREKPP
jgi:RNase P/RNase MRP subunit POP5